LLDLASASHSSASFSRAFAIDRVACLCRPTWSDLRAD
jgi:hypothetical protein